MNNFPIDTGADFCGVGAFDQALRKLGIGQNPVFNCDLDKWARKTFCLNYGNEKDIEISRSKRHDQICDQLLKYATNGVEPPVTLKADAEDMAKMFSFYFPFDVYGRAIPKKSLCIYMTTPPCQAFSMGGDRMGKEDRRGILFFNSLDFIRENRPRYFIFENVKGLLSHDKKNPGAEHGRTFQEWVNYLGGKSVNGRQTIFPYEDSVPYHIYHQVINAKDYQVPQNRERVFIVGIRDDSDNDFVFPKPTPPQTTIRDLLDDIVPEKYYLSERAIKKLKVVSDRQSDGIKVVTGRRTAEARARRSENMKKGLGDTGRHSDKEFVFTDKDYANTIVTSPTKDMLIMQNGRIRNLTPRESFRLMGFGDDFTWDVSDLQAYRQAGNSVVREVLAEIIAKLKF